MIEKKRERAGGAFLRREGSCLSLRNAGGMSRINERAWQPSRLCLFLVRFQEPEILIELPGNFREEIRAAGV